MLNTYYFTVTFSHVPGEWENENEVIEIRENNSEWARMEAESKAESMLTEYGEGWTVESIQLSDTDEAESDCYDKYQWFGSEYGTDLWN